MKKYLIYVGVALCLGLAANRIYQTFFADKSLAAVGECLEIQDPQLGRIEFKVIKNGSDSSEGIASGELMPGLRFKTYVRATYSELKGLGAKKTECSQ